MKKGPSISPAACVSAKNMAVRVGPYNTIIDSPYCVLFQTFITGGSHGTCVGCEAFVEKKPPVEDNTVGGS